MRSGKARFLFSAVIFLGILVFFSSCMERVHRVRYQYRKPVSPAPVAFNSDSLQFELAVEPNTRNVVLPFCILKGNKRQSRITLMLYGKVVSAREYSIRYTRLMVWHDTTLIGRSTDPELFWEQRQRRAPADAASPLYGTAYQLKLKQPAKMRLTVELDFEISNKSGQSQAYSFRMPLEKIEQKSFSLFNPLK
jgi:hypothetical protein